jgi:hypothetical protein
MMQPEYILAMMKDVQSTDQNQVIVQRHVLLHMLEEFYHLRSSMDATSEIKMDHLRRACVNTALLWTRDLISSIQSENYDMTSHELLDIVKDGMDFRVEEIESEMTGNA